MAISVTEILGTDSLSGSRLVINDNFNILTSEINAMENYFSPSAGTITNLNNLQTNALRVGLGTVRLDINASTFDIIADVAVGGGNISLNGGGLIRNSIDPQTLDEIFTAGTGNVAEVGTSTAVPPYTFERVGNGGTAPVIVQLNDGSIGQEIFFTYSKPTTGEVQIVGAINALILGSTNNTVSLDGQGKTVHLVCVDNGTGNGDWYIVGGNGYVIS
mgnify:CR=1 FL=1|jgi:hypothetical protein|tara:strand:- start:653 stop:1303 length:651 start_codon:yes stop_codon:yes gene_type:complete